LLSSTSGHQFDSCVRGLVRTPTTRDAVFGDVMDRSAGVAEILPRFRTHGGAYFFGQSGKRLTGGRAATLERVVVGIKRWQDKRVLDGMHVDVRETRLDEKRL